MKKYHPQIILDFVPGGCTGVHQPCDVGIQRPLKLSMKRSYHEDIVNKILTQLEKDKTTLTIDDRLGVLRNRSVRWLWNAYKSVNHKELVKRVRTDRYPSELILILMIRHSNCALCESGTCRMNA